MGYQKKNSRMFDVRPGQQRGDFLFKPEAENQPVLNLLPSKERSWREEVLNSVKTINLREKQPLKFLPKEVAVKKRRGRPKKTAPAPPSARLFQAVAPSIQDFVSGQPSILEGLEISHPSREEILAVFEEIEEINQYLKEYGLGKSEDKVEKIEQILSEPEQNLIEQQSVAIASADLPEFESVTWEEPEIPLWESEKEDIYFSASPAGEPAEESIEVLADLEIKEEQKPPDASNQWFQKLTNFFSWPGFAVKNFETAALIPANFKKRSLVISGRRQKYGFLKKGIFWRGAGFASAGFIIWLVIFGMSLAGQGLLAKGNILSSALQAYQAMLAAKDSASRFDFSGAQVNFEEAYQNFWQAQQELNKMGRSLIYVLEKLPGGSAVGSGAALVDAGENLAKAGNSFAKIAGIFVSENLGSSLISGSSSFTQKIIEAQQEIASAQKTLALASEDLNKVNLTDLPVDMRGPVDGLKQKMPVVAQAASQLKNWSSVFLEILGHQKPKKYLLIFQNNSEARPTGGFVGTYGVLDLDEGQIKNLFIDGIFNLDGQLYEKIIPPKPIQKISTAWSTHDANWFADFPTSAKKIMWFYEKAGGTTPDGVISLTPTVIERLLAITGPIEMSEYGVTLNQDNFMDATQYKVEVDYDKAQNQPKKILADFAPKFLDKLMGALPQNSHQILDIMFQALQEKHILFYFSDAALQKVFEEQGWAGNILSTDKDYLSVVNTNINGFKTDKVVEQKIEHQSAVQPDGAIIDTVKITRAHQGGQSQYDWYNRVNADYLRVYVPLGSKLLSAQGQTLEAYSASVDYQKLGFQADSDVAAQEQNMTVDRNSGTQIFSESGKTVFANWAYVSPGETVEITYQYLLPFKLNLAADNFSWSLLAQKQSGSTSSQFESILQLPREFKINWQYPANLQISGSQIKFSGDLKVDKFYGVVLGK